ncbi:GIY-YIG nuclease family protein [Candidatus Woesearchaeota archaeon]|jgi:hypothetical protein|nr:GIY-YIG nuclease family protein [Candidatus Woesearchaeota archaeon]
MNKKDLLDLIEDDDLGLLDIEKKAVSATPDDRLLESFIEINDFYKLKKLEPKSGGDIHEHKLASRLKHIRENKEQRDFLIKHDVHNLLKIENKELETVSDIFEDDDLDMLSIEDDSIFNIKNVPNNHYRKSAEFIARRKSCKDFDDFESLFIQCQEDIKSGKNKLKIFEHGDIKQGAFFVLDGILLYVESIRMDSEKDKHGKEDGRLRCIFENGTESNMRFRSLQKSLEINGRTIIDENNQITLVDNISNDDIETGYIYILKSLSTDPRINNTKNLFKIGFSTTNVEKRIQNAEQDPTYLMAPVSIVATYKCFNMNPHRFERLLHRFFGKSCLNIEVTDKNGNKYTPKEWFIAPIAVVEKAIELIINGEIINYLYDKERESIFKK